MENITLKTYTIPELAREYSVCTRTFYTWIAPIREQLLEMNPIRKKRIRILLPKQVKVCNFRQRRRQMNKVVEN